MKPFNSANAFDLSHEHLSSCHMGQLVPVMCEEVMPGDVWRHTPEAVVRLMPLVAPMMHNVDIYLHSFYVPYRILQDDFTKLVTGGEDGEDNTSWAYITAPDETGFTVGSLADYLGCPTGVPGIQVSALPFRAYAKIYNDWYRDQNLITELTINKGNGSDATTNTSLMRRCWKRDLISSAIPFVQRGPSVFLPIGSYAPVVGNGMTIGLNGLVGSTSTNAGLVQSGGSGASFLFAETSTYGKDVGTVESGGTVLDWTKSVGLTKDGKKSGLIADLSSATQASIPEVRTAFQIQRMFETLAFSGARWTEWLLSMFGVHASDRSLQRSEYLGGSRGRIEISEVLQTSSSDSTSPQGNMAGRAISATAGTYTKSFEEYGVIITLASIMPKAMYQQGLRRMWTRKTRFDWPTPVFAHIGNQELKNQEVYCQAPTVVDEEGVPVNEHEFGYVPRYEELRRIPSSVHGQFKTSLNSWHMGRIFENLPQLNQQFIECAPTKRVFAVTDASEDECLMKVTHNLQVIRKFPKFGTPGLIDHM